MANVENGNSIVLRQMDRKLVIKSSLRSIKDEQLSRPVVVLDRSGSMSDPVHGWEHTVGEERHRKIDALRRIVTNLRTESTFDQLVFDDQCEWTEEVPDPRGGTDLAGALREVHNTKPNTRRVVVVTDGYPNNREDALEAAVELGVPIDVFYVGPESAVDAIVFLKQLAETSKGQFGQADLTMNGSAQLENKIKLALNPAPKAVEMGG